MVKQYVVPRAFLRNEKHREIFRATRLDCYQYRQGPKIQKLFTDYLNVLQWLHTAVSSCKEDEVITSYCARVDLVIKRGPSYFETHTAQQVVEGNRTRRAPVRFGE